jgi:oxygen-independent coproporphyrinogen-3 oxidase
MSAGLYFSVPFCQTKCTYCNFHTSVVSAGQYRPYAEALQREIALRAAAIGSRNFDTIYFGGGTPSLLEARDLARVVEAARRELRVEAREVTLEADPETIVLEKAREWREARFNRVSLGAQSFNDRELQAAGRMHRRADIFSAVAALREAGIENISMDLIAGLPHQTRESWEESLRELIALRPEHVSVYLMEIDEGSRLGLEVIQGGARYSARDIPSDDAMAASYERACEALGAAGYEHYEISNWGLPGFRSRHNLKYWDREAYWGIGAGAHSFDGRERWANVHDAGAYVAAVGGGRLAEEQREEVSAQQELEERIFLGLRKLEGIDLCELPAGAHNARLHERVTELLEQGLLITEGSRVRLAPERVAVSNEVFVELLDAVSEEHETSRNSVAAQTQRG